MAQEAIYPKPARSVPPETAWDEKDELRRLDLLASVVAPASIAGIAISGAFIVSGKMVGLANIFLGVLAITLLFCTVVAILTLAFNPIGVIEQGSNLGEAIKQKRLRMDLALYALLISLAACPILAGGSQMWLSGSDHHQGQHGPRTEFTSAAKAVQAVR
jgi:hypothetical protein